MRKLNLSQDILPHLTALLIFLVVTVITFSPVFFDNRTLSQHDITQWEGSSKLLRDFREAAGEEGLWAPSMFSGMPAYLVNLKWSDGVVVFFKTLLASGLPHPVSHIFLAFVCYYVMLLSFGVRPWLSIAGALAFGLSSFMIIGLLAGHNARIGAIAFMPLVMAGIHLSFSNRRILGFGVTSLGLALHLRENHLQITYYLLLVVLGYGLVQMIYAIRSGHAGPFFKTLALLVPAAMLAAATFFGQFWAITEYSRYSMRGPSEIAPPGHPNAAGLTKDYAFQYSNGILEPMTLLIPNFYGGSSSDYLVNDPGSETFKALSRSNNQQLANQLAQLSSAYWGPQFNTAPYYAGAILIFLAVMGSLFLERKILAWLLPLIALSVMMSWGESFPSFNYFLFDYLPGYNKFRSVTFALVIALFSCPLLGMLGLEKLAGADLDAVAKKKLLAGLASTAGLCLLLIVLSGLRDYSSESLAGIPEWFTRALRADRKALLTSDAWRSLGFITIAFALIYFGALRRWGNAAFGLSLSLLITLDIGLVDRRYMSANNYRRKREQGALAPSAADSEIRKDNSIYRVYNIQGTMNEAHTSYHHLSLGGYHGAKLRRYQDLYDSCLVPETNRFIADARKGNIDFARYGIMGMLNAKYVVYGPEADNFFVNTGANGNAWFVRDVIAVNSPGEELSTVKGIDTRITAVVDQSLFNVNVPAGFDSLGSIVLSEFKPNYLKYAATSTSGGLAVFSEIYYPKGWTATIDGNPATVVRVNYVLRAIELPAGSHTVEFRFNPDPYRVGNRITMASGWLLLLIVLGSAGLSLKERLS
jgi:hypothetical protein